MSPASAPSASARCSSARATSSPPSASVCTSHVVRHEQARLLGIGEERHRRRRVDEHEVAHAVELGHRELGEVAEPFDRRAARAPFEPGREHLAEQLRARRLRDPARGPQRAFPERGAAEQQRGRFAGTQRLGDRVDRVAGNVAARRDRACTGRFAGFEPGRVGREDERRDAPGRRQRRDDRVGRVARDRSRAGSCRGSNPRRCARARRCRR